jgi:hypothetical protein
MAESPGNFRLAFSIPEDKLPTEPALDIVDQCLKEMARLLHIAVLDKDAAVQLLGTLRQLNDAYCARLGNPTDIDPREVLDMVIASCFELQAAIRVMFGDGPGRHTQPEAQYPQ